MGANAQLDQLLSKTLSARQQVVIGRIRAALVTCTHNSVLRTVCTSARRATAATDTMLHGSAASSRALECGAGIRTLPARFIRIRPALLPARRAAAGPGRDKRRVNQTCSRR